MAVILKPLLQIAQEIGLAARQKRLTLNMSQKTLASRSGVSLSVLKKFEHTGKISLESLLKLALVLDALPECMTLFQEKSYDELSSLEELFKDKTRKRGRQ